MNSTETSNNEIDVFDFIRIIWKWKIFIFGLVLTGLIIGGNVYYKAPVSYKSTVSIKIGKIGDIPLETYEDLNLNLLALTDGSGFENYSGKSYNDLKEKWVDLYKKTTFSLGLNKKESSQNLSTIVLTLVVQGSTYEDTTQMMGLLKKYIIDRHGVIYRDSVNNINNLKLEGYKNNNVKLEYFITSYSFPTEVLGNILIYQKKMGIELPVTGNSKWPLFSRVLVKKIITFFIILIFLGIFAALLLNYILTEVRKKTE